MSAKGLRIKAKELLSRMTGFSTPVFGVSWNPAASERDTVRGFLTFMEDRRALYVPNQFEVESDVTRSVKAIRGQCTETLSALPEGSPAIAPIRAIRGACRKFETQPRPQFQLFNQLRGEPEAHLVPFFTALGELRALVGVHIAVLATAYWVDLEAELASILPAEDRDGDT